MNWHWVHTAAVDSNGISGKRFFRLLVPMDIQNVFGTKQTGEIDSNVAKFWKENYDLSYIMKRDWNKLGPKLRAGSIFTVAIWIIFI